MKRNLLLILPVLALFAACGDTNLSVTEPAAVTQSVVISPVSKETYVTQFGDSGTIYGLRFGVCAVAGIVPQFDITKSNDDIEFSDTTPFIDMGSTCAGGMVPWIQRIDFRLIKLGDVTVTATLKSNPSQSVTMLLHLVAPEKG